METRLNVTRLYSLFDKKIGGEIVTIPLFYMKMPPAFSFCMLVSR